MLIDKKLAGNFVAMRCVEVSDAPFIVKLRTNEELVTYIHKISNDIKAQEQWIKKQQQVDDDYYFIVTDKKTNDPIGLASIYNIENNGISEFGRWVSIGSAIQNLEVALLLFDFAFNELNVKAIRCANVKDNKKIVAFWKKFGAQFNKEYQLDEFIISEYITIRENYYKDIREKHYSLLKKFL